MALKTLVNGVDVEELDKKAKALEEDPEAAQCSFRITNKWINCGHNRSTIKNFHAVHEDHDHAHPFVIDVDEPPLLLGEDKGANPVEFLLNALASCLTTSMVYHAAVRGIHIEELESTLEGDLDIRGFMGISQDVRKGYRNIRVTFKVKSDAPPERLRALCTFSPVFDVVSNGTKVHIAVEKKE